MCIVSSAMKIMIPRISAVAAICAVAMLLGMSFSVSAPKAYADVTIEQKVEETNECNYGAHCKGVGINIAVVKDHSDSGDVIVKQKIKNKAKCNFDSECLLKAKQVSKVFKK
jgi:hypothetical protein